MKVLATYAPFLITAIWIIGGIIAGFVLDRVVLARLQASDLFKKRYWLGIAIGAIRAGAIILCAVAGIYLAILSSHLDPRIEESLEKVLSVLLLAWATFVAARLAGGAIDYYGRGAEKQVLSASLFSTIAQVLLIVMGALIVLSSLGVAITPLLGALGVGGLAVALALKDTLSNLFSGVQIIASRQIRPGDYIKMVNSFEGYVEDINWRTTTIRELPNNLVVIPNEKLAQSVFTNYRLPESEIVTEVTVNVLYDSDLERVERAAARAARSVGSAFGERLSNQGTGSPLADPRASQRFPRRRDRDFARARYKSGKLRTAASSGKRANVARLRSRLRPNQTSRANPMQRRRTPKAAGKRLHTRAGPDSKEILDEIPIDGLVSCRRSETYVKLVSV